MTNKKITKVANSIFEQIKRIDENGNEYWSARDFSKVLEYVEYRNFISVLNRAKKACENSGQRVADHFVDMHEMVKLGSSAEPIHAKKNLKKNQNILDHMGSTELAANL
jgi:DNA-damage-inducible protein D